MALVCKSWESSTCADLDSRGAARHCCFKGVERLNDSYEVTVADVLGALEKQGLAEDMLAEGDALFFRYGWSQLWNETR